MQTNRQLLASLRTPVARFYPCDLHVHSVASPDVCIGERYDALPVELQERLARCDREPADFAVYEQQILDTLHPRQFYECLLYRRNELAQEQCLPDSDNWAIIGITDHNTAEYAAALSSYSWERRTQDHIVVLPGIELEVHFPLGETQMCRVHILCLFTPCSSSADIRLAINEARTRPSDTWQFGNSLSVTDLSQFVYALRSHAQFPAICIAAHVWSKKGLARETKIILNSETAEIARIEGALEQATTALERQELRQLLARLIGNRTHDSAEVDLSVLRLIGRCGFDALQVRGRSDETHYRKLHRFREEQGRATAIISSDAHTPSDIFSCNGNVPYVKFTQHPSHLAPDDFFRELRDRALRFGETRCTYSTPGKVTHWIEGIEIITDAPDARDFWHMSEMSDSRESTGVDSRESFILPLSRNLNALVGGRGSGKSAVLEALALLAAGDEFGVIGTKNEREWPEWYQRAYATLRGCQVRIVCKSTALDGTATLPKNALIATRYFDPKGRHPNVELTDADGQPIVNSSLRIPKVAIFRAHEIEQTARPENLRRLFDNLCGREVDDLHKEILELKQQLATQRAEILTLCEKLAELVLDGSPLRQYAIRKQQFDAVNRPEIREKYATIDRTEEISVTTEKTADDWEQVEAVSIIGGLEANTTEFFSDASAAVSDENGAPREGFEPLHSLVSRTASGEPALHEREILNSLAKAREAVVSFEQDLATAGGNVKQQFTQARAELTTQGLPTGGRDREAKKRAFEEAEDTLKQYRVLLGELETALGERKTLHDKLVISCQRRTELRKVTAESLTSQLAQDLDATVLQIEVDARPIADCAFLEAWMTEHIGPAISKYKPHRIAALLESGIMPVDLRQLLLSADGADVTRLCVDKARAEDGRISDSDAAEIIRVCRGQAVLQLDGADTWTPEFRDALPEDIRNGVWTFPPCKKTPTRLNMDSVLELDEIILDDLPEVLLNDRPNDPASIARPLTELSPGQRCSAILPILLLSGEFPLVIDQPEENLDNRLIRQVIVNILGSMKLRRQIIVATHNPNLPVLGDAEQCVILQATGRDESTVMAMGNLDSHQVVRYITDIMEGGREAFQYRHSIYQSHWQDAVELDEQERARHLS